MPDPELRLAEPLAALSVATDLARGRPPEQALRACIIARKLAECLGLTPAECATTFFASMLRFAGCTATSFEYSKYLGGNDVAVRFGGDAIDPANPEELGALLSALGGSPADAPQVIQVVIEGSRADCEVGARMAVRLGLPQAVADSLLHIFAIHHNAGERNGKKLEVDCCIVFNIEDGRIVDGREHFFNLYAWDEFWS